MENNNTELSHIRKFLKLQLEIEMTRRSINHYREFNRDTTELSAKRQLLEDTLEIHREVLNTPDENSATGQRFYNLKTQIQVIYEKLVPNRDGHSIDRNQCLILENYIYTSILNDLNNVLSNEFMGVSIPTYYYSASSDYDPKPLKELLSEILSELHIMAEPKTFIELFELIRSIEDRIIGIAKTEYDQNRNKSQIFN